MSDEIASVRAAAREVGRAVDDVQEIYLVGSQTKGKARDDSDFDLVAVVTGRLRRLSPNWQPRGTVPAAGFPARLGDVPTHWLMLSADDFDRDDFKRTSDYRHSPMVLLYERGDAAQTPAPTSDGANAG